MGNARRLGRDLRRHHLLQPGWGLKSGDPQAFFGPWLAAHGAGLTDAVLIDDRADNCAAFTREGGAAIQSKMGIDGLSDVTGQLGQWLNHDARDTRDEEFSVMLSAVVAS